MVNILTAEEILQKNIPFYNAIPLSDEKHIINSMKEFALQFLNKIEEDGFRLGKELENDFEVDLQIITDAKKIVK